MLSLVFAVLRSLAAALHSRRHLVMENLAKLGLQVSAATVRKYRPKGERGPSVWRSNHSGFDRKRAEALSWTLPCPRRRPAHPYLEYRAICHAGPAIPSTVHHDWGQQAPLSSRKIPPSFSTRLPDGVFVTHRARLITRFTGNHKMSRESASRGLPMPAVARRQLMLGFA